MVLNLDKHSFWWVYIFQLNTLTKYWCNTSELQRNVKLIPFFSYNKNLSVLVGQQFLGCLFYIQLLTYMPVLHIRSVLQS